MGPEREEVHFSQGLLVSRGLVIKLCGLGELHLFRGPVASELGYWSSCHHVKSTIICTCLYAWGKPLMHDVHRGGEEKKEKRDTMMAQ